MSVPRSLARAVAARQDQLRAARDAKGAARRALFAHPAIPGLRPRRAPLFLAAALFAVAAIAVAQPWRGRVAAGDAFEASAEPRVLALDDGSQITLKPGARARIERLDDRGATIALDRGSLFASVVRRPDARWSFLAGDYVVEVTGTAFDLSFEAPELRIAMHEGSVAIRGPGIEGSRTVVAGESLVLPEPVATSRPTEHDDVVETPEPRPTATATARVVAESWQARAARGDHAGAFELVAPNLTSELASLDDGALLRLATVARLSGHPDVARRIYLTLRERFAGTSSAAEAAFALGATSFSDGAEAERWFQLALAESPNHGLAASARGRLLELAIRRGDGKAAAADYLRHHPDGAHAALARETLAP